MVYYKRRVKPVYRRRKRWYVKAGANLPWLGKTTLSLGNGRMVKRQLNNVVRNLEQPLHKVWSGIGVAPPFQSMTHNTLYGINLTGNIVRGDNDNNRHGDTIWLEALKYRIQYNNVGSTNPASTKFFRMMIVKCDTDIGTASDSFGATIGATELFHGNNDPCFEHFNSKNCTLLYQQITKLSPQISSSSVTVNTASVVEGTLQLKQRHIYKQFSNTGKHSNIYLIVTSFEPGGVTGTTNTGFAVFYGDLIFKNTK